MGSYAGASVGAGVGMAAIVGCRCRAIVGRPSARRCGAGAAVSVPPSRSRRRNHGGNSVRDELTASSH